MHDVKEEFKEIFKQNITREGSQQLLSWLEKSDFFTAPASTKYHLAYEGGLCEHSINVYNNLVKLSLDTFGVNNLPYNMESVAIVALLHDLCKVNFYKPEKRNQKIDGVWQEVDTYSIDDRFPIGDHGDKSALIVQGFMKISGEEVAAINCHMGGFDTRAKSGAYFISEAFKKYPLAVLLHLADMLSTYITEENKAPENLYSVSGELV